MNSFTVRIHAAVLACTAFVAFAAMPVSAQDRPADGYDNFAYERSVIEDLLSTVVGLVRDFTLAAPSEVSTEPLFALSDRLSMASAGLSNAGRDGQLRADDLEQLRNLLHDLADQAVGIRQELRVQGHTELADRLRDVENGLLDAVALVRRIEDDASNRDRDWARSTDEGRRGDRDDRRVSDWPNDKSERRDKRRSDDDWADDDDWSDDDHGWWDSRRYDNNPRRWHWRSHSDVDNGWLGAHVGEFGYGWPFRETGTYRAIPAIRYNRVEGMVLGIRRLPLSWDSWDRARIYGHGGYAFGSDEWQYEIGGEARVGGRRSRSDVDLKLGGAYRMSTATQDIWKTSWLENSLAAFFFNHDFLDYFEVEGWTAYGALRLTPLLQVTAGYREEEYRSLTGDVSWSLFGGGDFRINPPIQPGDMRSVVVAVEGGSVRDLDWLPRGVAFRLEAEFGRDFGGEFDFNRYVGDARLYVPITRRSTLALRVRGGTSEGTLPLQKAYVLGGIGSMRSYPQNVFIGDRMLLGNVEYTWAQDWFWDDVTLSGFFDAGWVNNAGTDKFDFDDAYPSIGAGIGLVDRLVRLEVSWPLRDIAGEREPAVWLRVNPAF